MAHPDQWRVNKALKAYSKAETVNRAQSAFFDEAPTETNLQPPLTKGLERGDLAWVGLMSLLATMLGSGWLVGMLISWMRG